MRQPGAEIEKNQSGKLGVLRPTSANGAARFKLKAKPESRVTTRAGKPAEAVIKQFASQELQGEKEKMEGWKANVMREVARELQVIRQVHGEAIEAQKQNFQAELERLEKMWDIKSKLLEDEIRLLKNPGQHPAQKKPANKMHLTTDDGPVEASDRRPSSSSPAASNPSTIPSSSKVIGGMKLTKPAPKSYAQIAASNPTQSASDNSWTEVTSNNRKRKGNAASPPKVEPEKSVGTDGSFDEIP